MQKKIIRIGTRSSKLALWQANWVANKLQEIEGFEIKTEIVQIDSLGDVNLEKPLHELGITGVFTKSLDNALIKGDIDIAVHSMKDVPTVLPEQIVQAAVLKRAGSLDVLIPKEDNSEEFLYQKEAIIATGSLRRKAQWLHHYPSHTIVGLRGNVNTRMQKLHDSNWSGAVFAQAGLHRVKLLPKKHIKLNWMIPAPAQGVVMITGLEDDEEVLKICKHLNHKETEVCSCIERQFLNALEGGCTAPIGALAYIKEMKIVFKGGLFSLDGKQKIEIDKSCHISGYENFGRKCAEDILSRGGKRLMAEISEKEKTVNVLSTRQLALSQSDLFSNEIRFKMNDFIAIKFNRLKPIVVKNYIENVVITSQNAVEALLQNFSPVELDFDNIYCVGSRTKLLIEKKIGEVTHVENSVRDLAKFIVKMKLKEVTYFCGSMRRDELSIILSGNNIDVNEVEVYRTVLNGREYEDKFDGILFYSPSGVESFVADNQLREATAFCIGDTTAIVAKKYFDSVEVATMPTIESVIKLVNNYYKD